MSGGIRENHRRRERKQIRWEGWGRHATKKKGDTFGRNKGEREKAREIERGSPKGESS